MHLRTSRGILFYSKMPPRTQYTAAWASCQGISSRLTSTRVMSLVIFHGPVAPGCWRRPDDLHPSHRFTAHLSRFEPRPAGASAALNQWYLKAISTHHEANQREAAAGWPDGPGNRAAISAIGCGVLGAFVWRGGQLVSRHIPGFFRSSSMRCLHYLAESAARRRNIVIGCAAGACSRRDRMGCSDRRCSR